MVGGNSKRIYHFEKCFSSTPILIHTDVTQFFIVETHASQVGSDDKFHPLSYYSSKFFVVKINYEIYDKELLAIVATFEEWQHFLDGAQHPITIYLNHKNLEYIIGACILNSHQAQ